MLQNAALSALQAQLARAQDELARKTKVEEELSAARAEVEAKNSDIVSLKEQLYSEVVRRKDLQAQLSAQSETKRRLDVAQAQNCAAMEENRVLESTVRDLEDQLSQARAKLGQCQHLLASAESARDAALDEQKGNVQNLREEMQAEIERLNATISFRDASCGNYLDDLHSIRNEYEQSTEAWKQQLQQMEAHRQHAAENTAHLQQELDSSSSFCANLSASLGLLLSALKADIDLRCGVGVLLQPDIRSPHYVIKSLTGPAASSSLLDLGTRVTHIDGIRVAGLTAACVQSLLLGPPHSPVELLCLPATDDFQVGAAARDDAETPSGEFNNMLLNTTEAARNLLRSSLLLPAAGSVSGHDGGRAWFRKDGSADAQIRDSFRVTLLRGKASSDDAEDSDDLLGFFTQEAETGFACLQGMRSDVQMLKACVEMLQSLLDLHTSSTDDTLRTV